MLLETQPSSTARVLIEKPIQKAIPLLGIEMRDLVAKNMPITLTQQNSYRSGHPDVFEKLLAAPHIIVSYRAIE